MSTLAALAVATSRIRLGLLVAGVTYRHPSIFANQVAPIDHASHGRLDVGVGASWYAPEHRQLGLAFPPLGARFDLLEDELEILTRLMTGEVVSYRGNQISLDGAQLRPVPVQRPHPPIWIGGTGPRRTLPLVARHADVWHADRLHDYAELSQEVDRLAEAAGRAGGSIARAASLSLSEPWDEVRRNAEARAALGIDYVVCGWPGQGRARIEELVSNRLRPI